MGTDKLELEDVDVNVSEWDADYQANFEKLDDAYSGIEILEYGETIALYEAVYLKSDGKYWLAQGNGTDQPGYGLALDAGIATESKRAKSRGLVTNVAWTWTNIGKYIYLDPTTPGALTETQPADNAQIMGVIWSATSIFISPAVAVIRPQKFAVTFNGAPTASLKLLRFPTDSGFTLPADMEGSLAYVETTATASTVFDLRKILALDQSDASFGTITFLPDTLIDNAVAVDKTGGKVGIPITGHGFSTGQRIILSGTTNYEGTHLVDSTSTVNEVVIIATYIAESFAGTEDVLMNWGFFVAATATTFVLGDLFNCISPGTPDATLADLGFNLIGSRSE